jgi:SAM-dependent methyltransferase
MATSDDPTEPLFHECYDRLFASKDYAAEVEFVLDLTRDQLGCLPSRILEVGCGTGNHTLELARRRELADVVAVDIDRWMVARAKAKLALHIGLAAEILCCPVEELPVPPQRERFDLAIALFHVVTYIEEREALDRFFRSVQARLRPGAVFIFDCWNGTAALLSPPGEKNYEWRVPGVDLKCHLTSDTNRTARRTTLRYQICLREEMPARLKEEVHTLIQKLWMPEEIRQSLAGAGFQVVGCHPSFDRSRPAQDSDWKILFVVRNPS